jgi:two-component system phosphate regulon sensor histidine kinase PhoR
MRPNANPRLLVLPATAILILSSCYPVIVSSAMWRSRMFWRLFGTSGVLVLSSIGLLGVVIVDRVEQQYSRQIRDSLRTKALLVREAIRGQPATEPQRLQEWLTALGREIATRITLLAADGHVLADSEEDPGHMENHADRPEVREARDAPFGMATRSSSTLGQPMMYVALRADGAPEAVGYVRVALSLETVRHQLARLHRLVWTAAAGTAVAALVLAFWTARRITRPLQELTASAERIASGGYGHKVYAAGPDEIGTLARSFNRMSGRLASQFAELEEDRQKLRMILSNMVEGVVALDAEQRVLFANERAAQLFGVQPALITGRKFWEVVRRRSLQDVVQRALSGTESQQEELNWNGPRTQSLTVYAAPMPGSPPRGVVLVLHDTSELRRLERVRQEFVANVSHELKTPLSVIKACVETLLDGAVEDPQHRGSFLEQIAEQADRLHALILDILSLARIESGAEDLESQTVPLAPLVAACVERHHARAKAKNQLLEAIPPPATPGTNGDLAAWADEEAINQILDNLIDNALKYTPPGGRIGVRWQAEDGQVCLEVEDTGIGIPEQDLPRIFERFYRVDKARARELGGTGLGLAIVKHLVQAMHGSIQATSRLGRGTTFRIRLPRATDS